MLVACESVSGFDDSFNSAGEASLPSRTCDEIAANAAGDILFEILLLFITALALPLPTEVDFVDDVVSTAFGSFGGGGGGGCNRI